MSDPRGLLQEVLEAPTHFRGARTVTDEEGTPTGVARYTAKRLPDSLLERIREAVETEGSR